MTFVDKHQRIGRQIINQGRRRFARLAPRQMARVVFNAFAKAHFDQHFQIKAGALLDALTFEQLIFFLVVLNAITQFVLDRLNRTQGGRTRRNVVA